MERFILAQSDEQRDSWLDKLKKETGWPDWKIASLAMMINKKEQLALRHQFPILDEDEEKEREKYFAKRKKLLEKYLMLRQKTDELLLEQEKTMEDIITTNEKICALEGHRLSQTIEYFENYPYHTCLVCGKKVFADELTENDVVVKPHSELSIDTIMRK